MAIGSLLGAAKLMSIGPFQKAEPAQNAANTDSEVKTLVSLSPTERATQLDAIAVSKSASANQQPASSKSRARYLLATDLIQQGNVTKALTLLDKLEQEYPLLASHIALKRAEAYQLSGDQDKAKKAWQELLKNYPTQPVVAEALYFRKV